MKVLAGFFALGTEIVADCLVDLGDDAEDSAEESPEGSPDVFAAIVFATGLVEVLVDVKGVKDRLSGIPLNIRHPIRPGRSRGFGRRVGVACQPHRERDPGALLRQSFWQLGSGHLAR